VAPEGPVLVVGSGIAGLTFALRVAERESVVLITKKERADSSTNWARGGIAAVLGPDDDPALHIADTLEAGAGLCHREAVEILVREGPGRVRELVERGARFARQDGALSLAREGGHSRRRIVHAGDRTGREIERALLEAVAGNPRIRVLEDHLAVDLIMAGEGARRRCVGVRVLDLQGGRTLAMRARATFLASGGCGQVYRHTSNPLIATGDGVAMAFRAGAPVANMEFIQFHPTTLHGSGDPAFLISEALRGEGAVLRTLDGEAFMARYHPLASLAPRDVVARAIDREMRLRGDPHVLLDLSPLPTSSLEERFPDAVEGCRRHGVSLDGPGIPVVPAAHYACGGVVTDRRGRTPIPGLLAAGEVACTGVHGANRLASNSLLEAVVFSHRAAGVLESGSGPTRGRREVDVEMEVESRIPAGAKAAAGNRDPLAPGALVAAERAQLRARMWELAGIVRTDRELQVGEEEAEARVLRAEELHRRYPGSGEGVELRNLAWTALLIVRSALSRRESRGLHFNLDHPQPEPGRFLQDTALVRDSEKRGGTGSDPWPGWGVQTPPVGNEP